MENSITSMDSQDTFLRALSCLPKEISDEMQKLPEDDIDALEEVRIRRDMPISFICTKRRYRSKLICNKELLNVCINSFMNYSYYAYEEELANGYITIEGGHRIGVCGRVVHEKGKIRLIKDISSINIRHCREFLGVSNKVINKLFDSYGYFKNTLLVSPPKCGKTTLLRDILSVLSYKGYTIGICDERSEIAGMYDGKPSFDLGPNTDILDGCPKAEGMIMLIRSMAPDIIATDEIGKMEDIDAIETALNAGIGVITTIHGSSYEDLKKSKIAPLIDKGIFKRIVYLSNIPVTGSIKEIQCF